MFLLRRDGYTVLYVLTALQSYAFCKANTLRGLDRHELSWTFQHETLLLVWNITSLGTTLYWLSCQTRPLMVLGVTWNHTNQIITIALKAKQAHTINVILVSIQLLCILLLCWHNIRSRFNSNLFNYESMWHNYWRQNGCLQYHFHLLLHGTTVAQIEKEYRNE